MENRSISQIAFDTNIAGIPLEILGLDGLLQSLGITSSISIDALLAKAGLVVTTRFDVIPFAVNSSTTAMDVLINQSSTCASATIGLS